MKLSKFLMTAFIAGTSLFFVGCDKGGTNEQGDDPGAQTGNYPPVTIEGEMLSGDIKAGISAAVTIRGTGFDEVQDYIYVAYDDEAGEQQFERISGEFLEFRSTRISFGIHVDSPLVGKTVVVYLDRPGYDRMPISGEINFIYPEISDGYIPDAGFRASLMSTHPQQGNAQNGIPELFNSYGLIDVQGAAGIKEINLYSSTAQSLEGIELFTSCERLVAHEMANITEIDFSNWKSGNCFVTLERSMKLEKIVAGPCIGRLDCYDCENLKVLDLHHARWMYNLQVFSNTTGEYLPIETFDLRRQRTGTLKDVENPAGAEYCRTDDEYAVLQAGAVMAMPGTCHILVEDAFLTEKRGWDFAEYCTYHAIYDAWTRGATIDVYSATDIEKHLGTVPMYSEDPDALTLEGENNWKPNA